MGKHAVRQHLLRTRLGVVESGLLVAAVRQEGLRVGWLDWRPDDSEAPGPLPEQLRRTADLGTLRSVAVAGGRSVAVKPLRGLAVLGDVLREHFRGCALVLVDGGVDAPWLTEDQGAWRVSDAMGVLWQGTLTQFVSRLRRPRPWPPRDVDEPNS